MEDAKHIVVTMALEAGFSRARILSPFRTSPQADSAIRARYGEGSPTLLAAALPYGNQEEAFPPTSVPYPAYIAPFARRNYYCGAVKRLQSLIPALRSHFGGLKQDYRVLCNSPLPEKPLALACGLGFLGRNDLVITPEAGSLVILAFMTLPFPLEIDPPLATSCGSCSACADGCPTGAVLRSGGIDRERCIQWYASGNSVPEHSGVPSLVAEKWGRTLYGCTFCQDACPHNRRPLMGASCEEGKIPACFDAKDLLTRSDDDIKALFKGSALGLSWLKPEHIRRNALLSLGGIDAYSA